ncbi:MAG: PIG-L family deacetylase [Aquamicrobium sp.]|uniref:PIG-L deacetylase family protein n=1 Tax=Aquamicrobium sp. TaxID=1872579 RepID=UPI00349E77CA|nr:PIG-L family deacetylase [Aquamicrobium sp.]
MARHLILAPHHDDAEFGLGIAIQGWLARGDSVRVVIAATGSYRRADETYIDGTLRMEETSLAMNILGVTDWRAAGWFQENGALEAGYGELVQRIEKEIAEADPTDIYVCLPSFNQDHRALYDATVTAFRPGGVTACLHAYEYPGNGWQYPVPQVGRRYHPGTDGAVLGKINALRAHRSQFEGRAQGVNPDAAHALAAVRGAEIGVAYAEVTFLIREIAR